MLETRGTCQLRKDKKEATIRVGECGRQAARGWGPALSPGSDPARGAPGGAVLEGGQSRLSATVHTLTR